MAMNENLKKQEQEFRAHCKVRNILIVENKVLHPRARIQGSLQGCAVAMAFPGGPK